MDPMILSRISGGNRWKTESEVEEEEGASVRARELDEEGEESEEESEDDIVEGDAVDGCVGQNKHFRFVEHLMWNSGGD